MSTRLINADDLQKVIDKVKRDMPDATKQEVKSETAIRIRMMMRNVEKDRGDVFWHESIPNPTPNPNPVIPSRNREKSEIEKMIGKKFDKISTARLEQFLTEFPEDSAPADLFAAVGQELKKRKIRQRWTSQNRAPKWRKNYTKGSFTITNPTAESADVKKVTAAKETNRAFMKVNPTIFIHKPANMAFSVKVINGKWMVA